MFIECTQVHSTWDEPAPAVYSTETSAFLSHTWITWHYNTEQSDLCSVTEATVATLA